MNKQKRFKQIFHFMYEIEFKLNNALMFRLKKPWIDLSFSSDPEKWIYCNHTLYITLYMKRRRYKQYLIFIMHKHLNSTWNVTYLNSYIVHKRIFRVMQFSWNLNSIYSKHCIWGWTSRVRIYMCATGIHYVYLKLRLWLPFLLVFCLRCSV